MYKIKINCLSDNPMFAIDSDHEYWVTSMTASNIIEATIDPTEICNFRNSHIHMVEEGIYIVSFWWCGDYEGPIVYEVYNMGKV